MLLSRLEKAHNLCDLLGWQVTFGVVKIAIAAGAAAFDVKKATIECTETKQGSSLVGRGVCAAEQHGYSYILASGRGIGPEVTE